MISEKTVIKKYIKLMILCSFAYSISYIGRLSYNTNIPNIIEKLAIDKTSAGVVTSAFFFCYGIGQLINGMICEKLNSKVVISCTLIVSALITASLTLVDNIVIIAISWGVNGFLLSTLWSNLIKIMAYIGDDKYVKKAVIVMALSLPTGTLFAYGVTALLTFFKVWNVYFILAASIMVAGAIIFYFGIKDAEKCIFLFKEQNKQQIKLQDEGCKKETVQTDNRQSLIKVFSFAIICLFFMSSFSSIIKDCLTTWMPSYLIDNYKMPDYFSILVTLLLPIFTIFSSFFASWIMKKTNDIFKSCMAIFLMASVILFILTIFREITPAFMLIVIFAVLAFLMGSLNNLFTSILPLYYRDKLKSGKSAGIINSFCYVGSTISGFGLATIVDNYGWDVFLLTLLIVSFTAAIFSTVGLYIMKRKDKANG